MNNKDSANQTRFLIGIALLVAAAIMIYVGLSMPKLYYVDNTVMSETTVKTTESTTKIEYPLDINTATVDELVTISGIGDGIGSSIVMYREEYGPYKSLDELKNIRGINDRVLSEIAPYLTV